jgi:hypothetical protein
LSAERNMHSTELNMNTWIKTKRSIEGLLWLVNGFNDCSSQTTTQIESNRKVSKIFSVIKRPKKIVNEAKCMKSEQQLFNFRLLSHFDVRLSVRSLSLFACSRLDQQLHTFRVSFPNGGQQSGDSIVVDPLINRKRITINTGK